jgi:endonuclease/exonuclease/phosphatase family metal-dependent hydrolase
MADGIRLRVLTYNVHSRRDDVTALGTVVRDLAPDIAIIQEGPRRLRWRQKSAALARTTGLLVAGGGLPALGNLILTSMRVSVHDCTCVRFPLTPGRHMRGAVLVRCSVGRVPFFVVGTHLSLDAQERASQARLLKKDLAGLDAPVLFGADLNENSGGAAWRTLADGLCDAAVATDHADLGTFPAADPRDRIDAIFADPRCSIEEYQVVQTDEARAASDHLPLVVDLTVAA